MKNRILVIGLCFIVGVLLQDQLQGQIITKVAGIYAPGIGGPASQGQILSLRGIGFDSTGSLLYCEQNYIRRIDSKTGILTNFAGTGDYVISGDGGLAINANFGSISSFTTDKKGNCYLIDANSVTNTVRKITASTGIVTTIAGNGISGYSGDGGPATAAKFTSIVAIDIDAAGNIYILDRGVSVVRKIAASTGIISTIAGTGVAGYSGDGALANTAQLRNPSSLKIDESGNIIIADNGNYRIRRIAAATGVISTIMGDGTSASSSIDSEGGLAATAKLNTSVNYITNDKFNNIYFTSGGLYIRKINSTTGIVSTIVGLNGTCGNGFCGDGGLANEATLNNPNSCRLDSLGNLFIADRLNYRIRKVDAITQIINTIAGISSFSGDGGPAKNAMINTPQRMTANAQGDLFFVDGSNNLLRIINNANGNISTLAGTGSSSGASPSPGTTIPGSQLSIPTATSIALDPTGANIYACVNTNIVKINRSTGVVSSFAGWGSSTAEGVLASTALIPFNSEIATDATGNVYLVDRSRFCIRKITVSNNLINTIVGNKTNGFSGDGGQALAASIGTVTSLTIDPLGNLYFSDISNNRIRKVATGTNIITTIAGTGISGFSGDGGLATAAQIGSINSIASDASGNIYFVDGSRIRKIDIKTGIIATIGGTSLYGNEGDGYLATNATLNPAYLTVDKSNNVFIANTYFNVIRKISYSPNIDISIPEAGVLAGFTSCFGNVSAVQNFEVSGSNLIAPIIVTGNVLHEVSLSPSSGFASSVSINAVGGIISPTKIYTRVTSTSPVGINSGTIQVASTSAGSRITTFRDSVAAAPAKPTISASTASTFCAGGSIILTSNTNANYQWYKDGVAINGATSVSYTANTTGNYSVATANIGGCSSFSLPVAVTSVPLPATPTITAQNNITGICLNGTATLTSSAATGNQWLKDGVAISTATAASLSITGTANNAGAYTVIATVNSCPSALSNSVPITVENAVPSIPVITSVGSVSAICSGSNVTLTSSIGTGIQWFKDAIAISGANASTYIASQSGNFTVTASNGCGTANSAVFKLTVNSLPAAASIVPSSTTALCIGDSILITSSISSGNNWYGNNILIPGATQKIFAAKTANSYYSIIIDANGCKSVASNTVTVTTIPQPAKPTFSWNGVQFLTPATGVSYQWVLNNSKIIGATNSSYKPVDIGNYKLIITDANGCKNESDSFKLIVTAINVPVLTPSNHQAFLYPNPANSNVQVHFMQAPTVELKIQLVDLNGRIIKEIKSKNVNTIIPVSKYVSGNYVLKVIGNTYNQVLQLIITH
jgi:hypothetical protein